MKSVQKSLNVNHLISMLVDNNKNGEQKIDVKKKSIQNFVARESIKTWDETIYTTRINKYLRSFVAESIIWKNNVKTREQ